MKMRSTIWKFKYRLKRNSILMFLPFAVMLLILLIRLLLAWKFAFSFLSCLLWIGVGVAIGVGLSQRRKKTGKRKMIIKRGSQRGMNR